MRRLYQRAYLDPAPCGRRIVTEGGEHDVNKAKQWNEDQNYGEDLTGTPIILSGQNLRVSSQYGKRVSNTNQRRMGSRTYIVASNLLLCCIDQQKDPGIAEDEEHRERQPVRTFPLVESLGKQTKSTSFRDVEADEGTDEW